MRDLQSRQSAALEWIFTLVRQQNIPCLFCGGLAAIAYGSRRPLYDIDLFVPGDRFAEVVQAGRKRISKPAQHYCEQAEGWDLEYVQFKYDDVKIEVGSSHDVSIYHASLESWVALEVDFDNTLSCSVLGVEVPVMQREELIGYKRRLDRDVDREDVEHMLSTL